MERKRLLITAHAGSLNTVPNTRESLRACLEFVGQGAVEVDLRCSPDGPPKRLRILRHVYRRGRLNGDHRQQRHAAGQGGPRPVYRPV